MLQIDMSAPGIERLVSRDAPLDLIANDLTFGEGPLWGTREGAFYFVDIVGDTIWRWPRHCRDVFMRPSTKANGLTFRWTGPAAGCRLGFALDLARRARRLDVGDNDPAALFVTTVSGELFPVRAIPRLQAHRRATCRARGGAGQVDGRQD